MNDFRLDSALKGLAAHRPRVPEESVDAMVKTVRALNAERARRLAASGTLPAAAAEKELAPRASRMEKKAPGVNRTL